MQVMNIHEIEQASGGLRVMTGVTSTKVDATSNTCVTVVSPGPVVVSTGSSSTVHVNTIGARAAIALF